MSASIFLRYQERRESRSFQCWELNLVLDIRDASTALLAVAVIVATSLTASVITAEVSTATTTASLGLAVELDVDVNVGLGVLTTVLLDFFLVLDIKVLLLELLEALPLRVVLTLASLTDVE